VLDEIAVEVAAEAALLLVVTVPCCFCSSSCFRLDSNNVTRFLARHRCCRNRAAARFRAKRSAGDKSFVAAGMVDLMVKNFMDAVDVLVDDKKQCTSRRWSDCSY
jgi:hypothetical protein